MEDRKTQRVNNGTENGIEPNDDTCPDSKKNTSSLPNATTHQFKALWLGLLNIPS